MNRKSIDNLDKYLTGLFNRRKAVEVKPNKVFRASLKNRLSREYNRLYAPGKSENFRMPRWRWALAPAMVMAVVLIGVFYWNSTKGERELARLGSTVTDVESQIEILDKEGQELAWLDSETMAEDLTMLERYKQ